MKNKNYLIIFGWSSTLVTQYLKVFKMETFYIRADSRNLPKLDLEDIVEYAISNAYILKTKFRH